MSWKIVWSSDAALFMSKLNKSQTQRISSKLEKILVNPQHFLKRLTGSDDYKLRIGDYRILILIIHSDKNIFIQKIGHRKNVYEK